MLLNGQNGSPHLCGLPPLPPVVGCGKQEEAAQQRHEGWHALRDAAAVVLHLAEAFWEGLTAPCYTD